MTVINRWVATIMLQYQPLIVRWKVSLDSSRKVAQGCEVSFVNCIYLIPLIMSQNLCYLCYTSNRTGQRRVPSYHWRNRDDRSSTSLAGGLRPRSRRWAGMMDGYGPHAPFPIKWTMLTFQQKKTMLAARRSSAFTSSSPRDPSGCLAYFRGTGKIRPLWSELGDSLERPQRIVLRI